MVGGRPRLLVAWALLVFGLAIRGFAGGVLPPADRALVTPCKLDPNRASVGELQALPGVGPERAAAIVLERIRGGSFRGPEELLRVRGIGERGLATMRPFLVFGPPLASVGR